MEKADTSLPFLVVIDAINRFRVFWWKEQIFSVQFEQKSESNIVYFSDFTNRYEIVII